jgi:pantetheine-phosphate adenylyltransferase
LRTAIYPGTFDPFHNGHLDVTKRAAGLFDHLIVAVYEFPAKNTLFTSQERVRMVRESVRSLPNVEAELFSGLAVEYAKEKNAVVLVRGLRAISDFEFEFEIAHMNRNLDPHLEAIFLMTSLPYSYLRSSVVKEIAQLGGSLAGLVPGHVEEELRRKYSSAAMAGRPPTSNLVP